MSNNTFTLVGKFQDDISGPISSARASIAQIGGAAQSSFAMATSSVADLSRQLQDNIVNLHAERALLQDPAYRKRAQEAEQLKAEIRSLTGSIGDQKTTLTDLAGSYYMVSQAAGMVSRGVMSIVDAAKQYDSVKTRLSATEGSALLGEQDVKIVREISRLPGLGFGEAATSLAGLRAMRMSVQDASAIIQGIGKANASMGGTAEEFGRVMFQLRQSVGAGKLMGEDLRTMKEAIPNLGQVINDAFKTSDAEELNKKLRASGKSITDFWLDVSKVAQGLPTTGETIANNLDNLGDAWTRFKASLANTELIKGATGALTSLLDKLAEAGERTERSKAITQEMFRLQQEQERGWQAGADAPKLNAAAGSAFLAQLQKENAAREKVAEGIQKSSSQLSIAEQAARNVDAKIEQLRKDREAADAQERVIEDARVSGGKAARKRRLQEIQERAREIQDADREFLRATGQTYASYSMFNPGGVDREDASPSPLLRAVEARKTDAEKEAEETKKFLEDLARVETDTMEATRAGKIKRRKEAETIEAQAQKERLDKEKAFWKNMRDATRDGLAGILIAEQEGASWWSGIDGVRHGLVKAGIKGATSIGLDWLMGAAGFAAGGPAGGALGAGAMDMISSLLGFRANGGHTLNAQVVGEHGREVFRPATPGTIYNNSQSTNFTGGITVILPNARNAQDIARDLPRATRSAAANRRQTSR